QRDGTGARTDVQDSRPRNTELPPERLDADLRFYNTEIAMTDLDAVRAALGYETINLYGASYGTRAALTYLRLFPQRVRTVTLDAVVDADFALWKSASLENLPGTARGAREDRDGILNVRQ
ncbi:MAG: alpha/beta hydrolase, partial [Proteobacteria bacterium]|nr:alpha/beta hydrolase [Pseudomonadota bacterium]